MTRRRGKRPKKPQPTDPPLIRDLPLDERPRQRLLRSGPHSLSDPELLSILLGNGCREVCTLDLAQEILKEVDGLFGLVGIHPHTLRRRGLGEAKAASVLAAIEVARRLAHAEVPKRISLDNAGAVVRYLVLKYAVRHQEVMGALFIDVRHRLVGEGEIYRGYAELRIAAGPWSRPPSSRGRSTGRRSPGPDGSERWLRPAVPAAYARFLTATDTRPRAWRISRSPGA